MGDSLAQSLYRYGSSSECLNGDEARDHRTYCDYHPHLSTSKCLRAPGDMEVHQRSQKTPSFPRNHRPAAAR